jgi:hypothetical protein
VSVISRRMLSVPVRTSVETWTAIVDLVTASDEPARDSLGMIGNVAAMLIAEEYTREAPIVVVPIVGDRIRIYTVHGTAAIEAEDTDETPLATWPLSTAGWTLSLPCGVDDIDDVRAALQPYPFADVRDLTEGITVNSASCGTAGIAADAESAARRSGAVVINYTELERP